MDVIGEDHTSLKTYSRGREETIEEFVKGCLWLLLIKQSEQDKCFEEQAIVGREN